MLCLKGSKKDPADLVVRIYFVAVPKLLNNPLITKIIVKMSEKNNYHSVISEMSDHKTELF